MKIKLLTLIAVIVLISIAAIVYYCFRFSGLFYRNVSGAMVHDNTTETVYYQWLENNLNYSRSYIDSWPIKNGIPIGSLIQIEKLSCDQLKVGDVIVYNVAGQSVPIVHRIIKINSDGTFMTKGDHNSNLIVFPGGGSLESSINCSSIIGRVVNIV